VRILSNSIGDDAIEVGIVSKGDRVSCEVGERRRSPKKNPTLTLPLPRGGDRREMQLITREEVAIAEEEPHPNPPQDIGEGTGGVVDNKGNHHEFKKLTLVRRGGFAGYGTGDRLLCFQNS
jgi:hypothetical protein